MRHELPPEQYLQPCLPEPGSFAVATVGDLAEDLTPVLAAVIRKCNVDKRKLREWSERYE